jgi:hypothetical protein
LTRSTDPRNHDSMGKKTTKIKDFKIKQHPDQLDTARREIVFYEKDNPRCVVNLLPEIPKRVALDIPPDMLAQTPQQLRRKLNPNDMDEQLRLAFWDEYFLAMDNSRMIRMDAVYGRVCSREHFYKNIVGNADRFLWILQPPEEYMLKMRGLLEIGLNRFAEILQLPIVNDRGAADTKLIGQVVQIVSLLDNRIKGAVPQKLYVEGKSYNMNVNYEAPKSYEEINQEIKNIEQEILELQGSEVTGAMFQGEYDRAGEAQEAVTIETEAIRIESGTVQYQE